MLKLVTTVLYNVCVASLIMIVFVCGINLVMYIDNNTDNNPVVIFISLLSVIWGVARLSYMFVTIQFQSKK
ncbi:hypothetical protein Paride_0316 [Pseudomonas phage Paride]|nr:hypothetical protein ETTORE_0315 [Pseudomonas phage Ettore]WPK40546.1 hypothetical protein Paride_0316 [Pseudomonas phage Paride]